MVEGMVRGGRIERLQTAIRLSQSMCAYIQPNSINVIFFVSLGSRYHDKVAGKVEKWQGSRKIAWNRSVNFGKIG